MIRLASAALLAAAMLNLSGPAEAGPIRDRVKARRAVPAPITQSQDSVIPPAQALPPIVGAAGDGLTRGERLVYRIAKNRAAQQYAKEKGVPLAVAKAKVDALDDATIKAAAEAAGIVVKDAPGEGGPLQRFLDWLIENQDKILALVKLILTLLAFV